MCGINGIISWKRNPQPLIHAMNRHLSHRGPDGDGVFLNGAIALGHVRLSVLDLTNAGAQPMRFNHWVLTFNGEIYNFRELQKSLIARGYMFESRSDTEVLLKAWDYWGMECLSRLEGMFAFAIYNTREKIIYLCRDSYGVKPIFYSHNNNEFIFSSELATLVQAQSVLPGFDSDALATFLALHYVPSPQTGLTHLKKLQAGHCLTACCLNNELDVTPPIQWHKPFLPTNDTEGLSLNKLDNALFLSVQKQMVSDVPVGAFLSGGVDSSLICYYASKVSKEPLHTFSVGFSDAGQEYDETIYATQAARIIGTEHHPIQVRLEGVTDLIDKCIDDLGELNADSSVFLNYIVSSEARKHVTVCLSGAGGDEMFGGYYRHQALLALDSLNKVPIPTINLLRSILNQLPQHRDNKIGNLIRRVNRFLEQRELVYSDFLTISRQDNAFPQKSSFLNQPPIATLLKALEFDFKHYLGDNILSFSDKMSMLHGLEVRVPFLDSKVIEMAEQLNNNQRVTLTEKKILLKKLASRYFPYDLIYRKKQGFAAPLEVWLRNLSKIQLKQRCTCELSTLLVTENKINQLVNKFLDEKKDLSLQLYSLIVLNKWCRLITNLK